MKIKILKILTFCVSVVFINQSFALDNKILFKINNEIISTIDLYNETKYLSLLNENLANLKKKKVNFNGKISFNSSFPDGVTKKNLNSQKIKKLGWKPKVTLEKGIEIILKSKFKI